MTDESADSPKAAAPTFKFDLARWSQTDRIVAVATLALFISLFLAWFGAGSSFFHVTVDGLWHGYMYLTLIVCLLVMGYLAQLAGLETPLLKLPISHPQILLAAGGLNFFLTLISFLTKPSGTSWQYGAYIGLIAAFVAFAPGWFRPFRHGYSEGHRPVELPVLVASVPTARRRSHAR